MGSLSIMAISLTRIPDANGVTMYCIYNSKTNSGYALFRVISQRQRASRLGCSGSQSGSDRGTFYNLVLRLGNLVLEDVSPVCNHIRRTCKIALFVNVMIVIPPLSLPIDLP